jgi:hypothetical protein
MEDTYTDINNFITTQVAQYENESGICIEDNWYWSMKKHIALSVLYKNSQLSTGKNEFKPVKNIVLPILRLQYRAEGFDVKDVKIFVNDQKNYFKSFLVRKYHEVWARKNNIDTFIDELVQCYVDFGGALVKNVDGVRPEVVQPQSIAFCDQTDILSGPIGIRHYYSPDQLLAMAKVGWGNTKNGATATLQEVINLAQSEKKNAKRASTTKTPGKYVEVVEVHGELPKRFLNPFDTSGEYSNQLHIATFYQNKNGDKKMVTLYAAEEAKSPFKMITREGGIFGRALGFGGVEELFEAQVWTNYSQIRMQDMLDSASKTILQTDDDEVGRRNSLREMDNLEIITMAEGKKIEPVNTLPASFQLFNESIMEWGKHAEQIGSATGALLGEMPATHTSYNMMALVTSQGQAIHDYRRGQISTFVSEIYRDWILPYLAKEITQGKTFLAELDNDELTYVSDSIVASQVNKLCVAQVIAGKPVLPEMLPIFQQQIRQDFMKRGEKHFIEILKGEMKSVPLDVEISIANKQKDLGELATQMQGIFKFVFSTFNPQTGGFAVFDDPRMASLLNQMLEASGLDQIDAMAQPPHKVTDAPPGPQPPGLAAPAQQYPIPAPAGHQRVSPADFNKLLTRVTS